MKNIIFLFLASFVLQAAFAQQKPEGLFINSKAFDFKARDQNGKEVNLKELRKKGPVVVMFYRGYWCPFCNKTLKRFNDSLQMILDKGAQLVAITPETAEGISTTIEKTGVVFPIITDDEMKIAEKYGVGFNVDDRTLRRYKNADIDLLKINNQKQARLPVPAVYVINEDGAVTFRFFDEDYKKSVSVKEILKAL
jgi:peroxiredoxin